MGLRDEILEQPQVMRAWLGNWLGRVKEFATEIRSRRAAFVYLAARGTSDNAGVYAQYLWGEQNGLAVAFSAPSLFTRYAGGPRLDQALVVGVSQSGQSPDVVQVVAEGRRQGALTLAITNEGHSPLAQAAEFVLELQAGEERAVAATKTYTSELLALASLSAALRGDSAGLEALHQIPETVEAALGLEPEVAAIAQQHAGLTRCVILGRGYHYPTTQEWALKLKELTLVLADPYSAADFQHGPIALMETGLPVFAIAPRGAVLDDVLGLLGRLRDNHSADLLVLSDDDRALSLGRWGVRLPSGAPEWLMPLVSVIPAQFYVYHLALARGMDPDAPRHVQKVTLTR